MTIIMVVATLLPLTMMAAINHYQYQKALSRETIEPLKNLVNKTQHSFELFLTERLSAVSFIAAAYTYHELADQKTLTFIFHAMKEKFGGFVDLGMIDASGLQVSYVGPYDIEGKQYKDQEWFKEVLVRGEHISDVFMGHRKFPHFVIAVQNENEEGEKCILRATIDTELFNQLIASMGLDAASDAFVLNRDGVFQTTSKFYGKVLEKFPMSMPPLSYSANVLEMEDSEGSDILLAYCDFSSPSFVLMLVKPQSTVHGSWYTLKGELLFIFIGGIVVIFLVVFKITDLLVKRIEESDRRREITYHQTEHTNKLASIGRLAAGIAHEINNPLAIINEKSGLMEDLIQIKFDLERKGRLLELTGSIRHSVERCSTITHRLLGFARRMDAKLETINLREVFMEVFGFLEKEAAHRNITVHLQLDEALPDIYSDHGQLQQVFLNILNNAFSAVDDGGIVTVTSFEHDADLVGISIADDGVGMSEETMKHVFDPFFSTRGTHGTGLGLSITYGIVNKLGGKIDVQSKEDEGTTFTVYLPKKSYLGRDV